MIVCGDSAKAESLIATYAIDVTFVDLRMPALQLAAQFGRVEIVEMLLRAGAHLCDSSLTSVCGVAVEHGHADVVAVLLRHKPDPEWVVKNGRRLLEITLNMTRCGWRRREHAWPERNAG